MDELCKPSVSVVCHQPSSVLSAVVCLVSTPCFHLSFFCPCTAFPSPLDALASLFLFALQFIMLLSRLVNYSLAFRIRWSQGQNDKDGAI